MDKKTKKLFAVVVMAIAVFIFSGFLITIIIKKQHDIVDSTFTIQNINSTQIRYIEETNEVEDNKLIAADQPTTSITPVPSSPMISPIEENIPIAQITFQTDKKTRKYDVMADVDEDTLKKNIGHLPSSAWFGEEGLCVLMGHRDTDLSILQYVEVGDTILIKTYDNEYRYCVERIDIVDSDDELSFDVMTGSYLVLVTCYPFRYNGHAPEKYLVYAKKIGKY